MGFQFYLSKYTELLPNYFLLAWAWSLEFFNIKLASKCVSSVSDALERLIASMSSTA